jgi:hypothetical protein
MDNSKPWYLSKTIWANLVAAIGLVLNSRVQLVGAEELGAFVVIINLILRLVTRQPLGKTTGSNAVPAFALLCLLSVLSFGCASIPPGYDAQLHPRRDHYIGVAQANDPAVTVREIDTSKWAENRPAGEVTERNGREAVQVRATEDGVQVGFDLLGIRNYRAGEWAQRSWGPLKLLTYPLDYIGYMATKHPFQTIGLGLVAWEVADNGVSDLFGGGDSNNGSGKAEAPTMNTGTVIQVTGDGNTVTYSPSVISTAPAAP